MIKLSIIIPHYNSISSLLKLLESIPETYAIQVIVVDDNSDKEEKEKYKKLSFSYSRNNVEFHTNTSQNKGAGACRNIGLKHAKGDWLLFADADDYFLGGFIEKVKKYFNSENDVVFFKPTSIQIDTGDVDTRHLPYSNLITNYIENKNRTSELFLKYRFYVPWSKLIKHSFVKNNQILFEEVIASNDIMFSTKIGCYLREFEVSEEIIYCVTRNSGTLTTTVNEKIFDSRFIEYLKCYTFLKAHLTKNEFILLDINDSSGLGFILNARKFGYKKTFEVHRKLRKKNVRILNPKMINPVWIITKLFNYTNKTKRIRKYRINN
ncbi:glycosyltransferase family 2 protein [Ammoniphilus resinae]|uniref:Glycosyltransferase involved in cell wall biosynthesis n=1 Tax=Ammoniphilus resinae TaxID=861532 RepID=A0ABS4GXH9_9BACL|nr:glycosyltransferase family 2 protein [Ammoniphilus resinae]MBP1934984.1 glycosyltransferase involved in cell wall biosynthesis [Ammoniphilus resinae]